MRHNDHAVGLYIKQTSAKVDSLPIRAKVGFTIMIIFIAMLVTKPPTQSLGIVFRLPTV